MKVLIALDDSDVSRRAAAEAVRLFGGRDAEFWAINVAHVSTPWVYPTAFGDIAPMMTLDLYRSSVAPELDSARAIADRAGLEDVDVEVLAEVGDPVGCICAAADEHDVDVIVVGSHDQGALAKLLNPSVAAGVEREAHRPVLVIGPTTRDEG